MGRLSSIILLVAAFAGSQSAPTATTIIHQPAQYFLLQPQPSTIKIQPHLVQPIQHLKLEPKQQLIYYYPSIPLSNSISYDKPIRLVTLKQEEQPWWQGFVNFFQPSTEKPAESAESATEAPAAPAEGEPAPATKSQIFMAPADAEQLPAMGSAQPSAQGHRYYILSGAPQFYGNFDALQNPLNPIFSLQPLQAIHARSNSEIQAEPQIVSSIAPIAPVPALVPAQLKNDLLESHPDKTTTIERNWARSLDDEPVPEPEKPQGRSQSDDPKEENMPQVIDDEEDKKEDMGSLRQANEPSVAAVKPAGIALAGRGGLAASAPTGTAIAGKNGLALSSPTATSVAGNFFEDEEDKKN
ncbi:uncharacterized protein LOC134218443 [Armigeres subalbatus]|uniref:uncharacterized protein LOC134218443 n=1 Tax=Armigeres subalbatus TaxID=124917 RepID=UPI002ED2458C